jgi:ketosteroid isomerase-like protein
MERTMTDLPHSLRGPALAAALIASPALAATDAETIAALDTAYQAAVERNDWQTMDRMLHPDFALVLGDGRSVGREQLIDSERKVLRRYEKQVEVPGTQQVRMYGPDTATVTALLWLKGTVVADGKPFDYKLWFTDTYVRTKDGWKYAFGQASLPLPPEAPKP